MAAKRKTLGERVTELEREIEELRERKPVVEQHFHTHTHYPPPAPIPAPVWPQPWWTVPRPWYQVTYSGTGGVTNSGNLQVGSATGASVANLNVPPAI